MTNRVLSAIAVAVVGVLLLCSGLVTTVTFGGGAATAGCYPAAGAAPDGIGPVGKWSAEQVGNAVTIITVGMRRQIPPQGWVIAVATTMQESSLVNLPGGDRDSVGLFQQRPSQGWGTAEQLQDPTYAAAAFYDQLSTIPGWQSMPLTEAAQQVQRSATPNAYAKWQADAEHLVEVIVAEFGIVCTGDGSGIPAGFRLPTDTQQATAVAFALAQLGKPYVWGAEGPEAYDCSGLTMAAWAKAGVPVPRIAADQARTGVAVGSLSAMQPGDLIFIPGSEGSMSRPGHVGIYIGTGGDGQRYLVHAPQTGDVVKVAPVSGWSDQIAAIRRPLKAD